MMNRREFVKASAFAGAAVTMGGCRCPFCGAGGRVPYGDTIGDRLWMWGHHAMSFAAQVERKCNYNLPLDRRIDMAAACKDMNIPGCFLVRWFNLPKKADLPVYMKQFGDTKRVGFSITDAAVETFEEKVRLGLEYADRMPNLTTLIMDDFWSGANNSKIEQVYRAKEEIVKRDLRLSVVLYSDQNGLKSEYREILDLCDEVTFWFWHGKNVNTIEAQVAKLKDLIGMEKPVLLGQYMYDFGGKKEMSGRDMETQLAATSRLLSLRAIDGVIFHCTPLVDMNLDAVNVSRAWIRENALKEWGRLVVIRVKGVGRRVVLAGIVVAAVESFACTGMYVGKAVSEDGTVLLGRTVDTPPWTSTHMYRVTPAVADAPGRTYRSWKNGGHTGR